MGLAASRRKEIFSLLAVFLHIDPRTQGLETDPRDRPTKQAKTERANSTPPLFPTPASEIATCLEMMNAMGDHSMATRKAFVPFLALRPELDELVGGDWSALESFPEWARCRLVAMRPGGPVAKLMAAHAVSMKVGASVSGVLVGLLNRRLALFFLATSFRFQLCVRVGRFYTRAPVRAN